MTEQTPLVLEVLVDPAEQEAVTAGAELLSEFLRQAVNASGWPVHLWFRIPGELPVAGTQPAAVIASLLPEADRLDEPIEATKARWRVYLSQLQGAGAPVFLFTVFRHVQTRAGDGVTPPVLERIRRLNVMAAELSHELGVAVVDIDRAFAHIGGRVLKTDYRMTGILAAEVGGHTLAWSLLSFGLDDLIDPAVQETAKAYLKGLDGIDALVEWRLLRRQAARQAAGVG